jgi:anaerobic ribonucleoside-triphosphate reductase activating protein
MIRYKDVNIVLQEIPGEITLVFTITGCSLNCKGCHSSYLWKKGTGNILSDDIIKELICKYKGIISCVLFMGGEWESDLVNKIKLCNSYDLKTALYTGLNLYEVESLNKELLSILSYIKVGRWIEELGGLSSLSTNQRLINLKTGDILNKKVR